MTSDKRTQILPIISFSLVFLGSVLLLLNLPALANPLDELRRSEDDRGERTAAVDEQTLEVEASDLEAPTEKLIMGWLESVYIDGNLDSRFKAKLDSGAKTSSIHATNISYFEKNQQDWVRFTVHWRPGTDKAIGPVEIERPVLEYKKIKLHNQMSMVRPVIELPIALAGKEYLPRFNLVDRAKFLYPVLLGRRFLRDVALIDPDSIFLTSRQLDVWLEMQKHQNTDVVDINH